jgi:hypothetical protein
MHANTSALRFRLLLLLVLYHRVGDDRQVTPVTNRHTPVLEGADENRFSARVAEDNTRLLHTR